MTASTAGALDDGLQRVAPLLEHERRQRRADEEGGQLGYTQLDVAETVPAGGAGGW